MIILAVITASILTGTSIGYAKPQEPLKIAPSAPWRLDYAANSCTLMREFGVGDDKITLLFDRIKPGDEFQLSIFGKNLIVGANQTDATIEFAPHGGLQNLSFYQAKTDDGQAAIILPNETFVMGLKERLSKLDAAFKAAKEENSATVNMDPVTDAEEGAIVELKIGRPLKNPITLQTGPMGKVF